MRAEAAAAAAAAVAALTSEGGAAAAVVTGTPVDELGVDKRDALSGDTTGSLWEI